VATQRKISYNQVQTAPNATTTEQAIANLSNTVSRPGPLTTEWWTVLVATGLTTLLGIVGVKGSTATQLAATVAPVVLALAYAFVRAHTKGALANALAAVFPQASSNPVEEHGQANATVEASAGQAGQALAVVRGTNNGS
jgi:hypothetical protein